MFCPLGKRRRDTPASCSSSEVPLPNLAIPNIIDTGLGQEGSAEGLGTMNGDLNNDPCAIQVGYPVHVCCNGPPGRRNGEVYESINNRRPDQLIFTVSVSSTGAKINMFKSVIFENFSGFVSSLGQLLIFVTSLTFSFWNQNHLENENLTISGYFTFHKCKTAINACCEKYLVSAPSLYLKELESMYLSIYLPT